MHAATVHQCHCPDCLQPSFHPNKEFHRQLNLLLSRLDEPHQRWLVALEANRLRHGGNRLLSLITGLHVQTIRRGRRELANCLLDLPPGRIRRPGAGRPSREKKTRPWKATCSPCW
jgi:hypothetical protein